MKVSQRLFVEGTGAGIVAASVPLTPQQVEAQQAAQRAAGAIPRTTIRLTVNGQARSVEVEDRWTLVELLRDHLQLTGTKIGCDRGECGARTVLVDGKAVMLTGQRVTADLAARASAIVKQTLLKVGASA